MRSRLHALETPTPRSAAAPPATPILLADRDGVAFVVAADETADDATVPRRAGAHGTAVVTIPVSAEELRGTELQSATDGAIRPRVAPRPDLLSPALVRLISREHRELSLQPGRDGLRAALVSAQNDEQPYPVAPKDAAGLLAAVFLNAPRGVVQVGSGRASRVLVSVRPGPRRHEYRLRLAGTVTAPPPAALGEAGLSPAALEILHEVIDQRAGLLLVAGGPSSGRSLSLDLIATALLARGRSGARIGSRGTATHSDLPSLAGTLLDWPFPESLLATRPDFIQIDRLEGPGGLLLAARLAASGTLVIAGTPAGEPEALLRAALRRLDAGAAPAVPLAVLGQTLLRTVCRRCAGREPLSAAALRRYGFHRRDLEEIDRRGGMTIQRGAGCPDCAGTGAAGLTGAFDLAGAEEVAASLPRLREEGWRKVLQGQVCFEDVALLPGAHREMRTFREILVLAGCGAAPLDEAAASPDGAAGRPAREAASSGVAGPADGPLLEHAVTMTRLFAAARASAVGDLGAPLREEFRRLARAVAEHGAGGDPLAPRLVPSEGFDLAAHAVNTALIATRIGTRLGGDSDPVELAALALLHDVGLLRIVVPGAASPAVLFEEELDTDGERLRPGGALERFGPDAAALADLVTASHDLLTFRTPAPDERARADARAQLVAVASLMDLRLHGPQPQRAADLNEATSIIMEQHGRRFSRAVLRALLKAIPVFPIGALVELSSGDRARVVALNEDNHFRPRVEITSAAGGEILSERRVVDLARAPFLHIRQRLPQTAGGRSRP